MRTDGEAVIAVLTHLILLEPGTIQSHPKMGVGLVSRYRYSFTDEAYKLQSDIRQQIDTYLPQYQGADVSVTAANKSFNIKIVVDGILYQFLYDIEKTTFQTKYRSIADL